MGEFYVRVQPGAVAGDGDTPAQWMAAADGAPRLAAGTLEAAARDGAGARVVMLAPTEDVLLTEADLPGRNRQRLRQALPYAMEEQLIDDVEEMAFFLGPPRGPERYSVAAVHRRTMERWLGAAQAAGLHLDVLIPDVFALPLPEDGWSVFLEPDRVLVRTGATAGFAASPDTAGLLLGQALQDAGEAGPARIRIYADAADSAGDVLRLAADAPPVETVPHAGGLLGLAAQADAGHAFSLLQGEFSPRAQLGRKLRPWYPSAALLLVLLLLQPAVFFYEYFQSVRQSERLRQEIETVFRQAVPEVSRVVNPRAQMDARLKELRARSAGAGAGFVDMLATAGPLLARGEVRIKSLRYRDGQLDVELEAPDFQRLDQLKQQLAAAGGWNIEIQSATARGERVDGRLLIRG